MLQIKDKQLKSAYPIHVRRNAKRKNTVGWYSTSVSRDLCAGGKNTVVCIKCREMAVTLVCGNTVEREHVKATVTLWLQVLQSSLLVSSLCWGSWPHFILYGIAPSVSLGAPFWHKCRSFCCHKSTYLSPAHYIYTCTVLEHVLCDIHPHMLGLQAWYSWCWYCPIVLWLNLNVLITCIWRVKFLVSKDYIIIIIIATFLI